MGQSKNCDRSDSSLREVLQTLAIKPTHHKRPNDPRINDLFDSKCNQVAESSEEAMESAALIKCRIVCSTLLSRKSLPLGVTLVICVNISVTQFAVVQSVCHISVTQFHILQLADLCPSLYCWRFSHVPQDTGLVAMHVELYGVKTAAFFFSNALRDKI